MNPNDPYQPRPSQPQPYAPQPTSPPQPQVSVPPLAATGTTTGHNPYEFIFSDQQHKKGLRFGSSLVQKVFLISGGLSIFLVLVVVITSVFGSGGSSATAQLKVVTQRQQEVTALAVAGETQLADQALRNTAATIQLSVGSDQQKTLSFMKTKGVEMKPKELALLHDSTTDKLLADAKSTSTYDTTWRQTMRTEIEAYVSSLQKLNDEAKSGELKKIVQTSFKNAQLSYDQLK